MRKIILMAAILATLSFPSAHAGSGSPTIEEIDQAQMAKQTAGLLDKIDYCTGSVQYLVNSVEWEWFHLRLERLGGGSRFAIVQITDKFGTVLLDAIEGNDEPLYSIANREEGLAQFGMYADCVGGSQYIASAWFTVDRLMPGDHIALTLLPQEVQVTLPSLPEGYTSSDVNVRVWYEDENGFISFSGYVTLRGEIEVYVPTYFFGGTFYYEVTAGDGTVLLFGDFDPAALANEALAEQNESGFSLSLAGGIQLVDLSGGGVSFQNQRLEGRMDDPDCPEGRVCEALAAHTYVAESPTGLDVSVWWPNGAPDDARLLVYNQREFRGRLTPVDMTFLDDQRGNWLAEVPGGYEGKIIVFVTMPANAAGARWTYAVWYHGG